MPGTYAAAAERPSSKAAPTLNKNTPLQNTKRVVDNRLLIKITEPESHPISMRHGWKILNHARKSNPDIGRRIRTIERVPTGMAITAESEEDRTALLNNKTAVANLFEGTNCEERTVWVRYTVNMVPYTRYDFTEKKNVPIMNQELIEELTSAFKVSPNKSSLRKCIYI